MQGKWTPTRRACEIFQAHADELRMLIRSQVRRYRPLPVFDHDDMEAEGMLIVLRALGNLHLEPGRKDSALERYVSVAVRRNLAGRIGKLETKRKRIESLGQLDLLETFGKQNREVRGTEFMEWRGRAVRFWEALQPRDRGVLFLCLCPPPELAVLYRNLTLRRHRLVSAKAVAHYTGLAYGEVRRSLKRSRTAARQILQGDAR